eukprot:scaffold1464_cov149-Skeletonema_menzelii.AAC.6
MDAITSSREAGGGLTCTAQDFLDDHSRSDKNGISIEVCRVSISSCSAAAGQTRTDVFDTNKMDFGTNALTMKIRSKSRYFLCQRDQRSAPALLCLKKS